MLRTLGEDTKSHADNQGLHDFFSMVIGAANGWDGSEPSRPSRRSPALQSSERRVVGTGDRNATGRPRRLCSIRSRQSVWISPTDRS